MSDIRTSKRFRLQNSGSSIELLDVDWDNGGNEPGLTVRFLQGHGSDNAEILLSLNAVDAAKFRAALWDLFEGMP